MKIAINKVGIHTALNGHKTRVYVDHMVSDKRCLGGYKLSIRLYSRGRGMKSNPLHYTPIGRVEILS